MSETKKNEDQVAMVKVINGTVYRVRVHFSETAKETMEDKLIKLITRELNDKRCA